MVGFRGVTDQFDSSWAVFADRIVHPTLDSASLALVRDRMVREARLRMLDPEGVAHYIADSLAFEATPMHSIRRDRELVDSLSSEIVRRYVSDEFVTSRLLLVVVGKSRARGSSRSSRRRSAHYRWRVSLVDPARRSAPPVVVDVRPTRHTHQLHRRVFRRSIDREPRYPAFRIATAILSSRLSSAIRYDADLSYSAARPIRARDRQRRLYASTTTRCCDGAHAAAARFDEESGVRRLRVE